MRRWLHGGGQKDREYCRRKGRCRLLLHAGRQGSAHRIRDAEEADFGVSRLHCLGISADASRGYGRDKTPLLGRFR
jgi:hypothetical protein